MALQWNDGYQELIYAFTNTINNRDGGTHLAGLQGGADAHDQHLRAELGPGEEPQGEPDRRRHARGADGRRLGASIKDPKFSSQTKDKLVSSDIKGWVEQVVGERLGHVPGGEPARGAADRREVRRGGARPRGGAQGAGPDAAQGRARRLEPARQARRLLGAQPRARRALPGRGRFRRRLGQAGARPAASRPSCRSRARS